MPSREIIEEQNNVEPTYYYSNNVDDIQSYYTHSVYSISTTIDLNENPFQEMETEPLTESAIDLNENPFQEMEESAIEIENQIRNYEFRERARARERELRNQSRRIRTNWDNIIDDGSSWITITSDCSAGFSYYNYNTKFKRKNKPSRPKFVLE